MISTRQLLTFLRDANPERRITEDLIRVALRRGRIPAPSTFAGRLLWTHAEARAAAKALGLNAPPPPRRGEVVQ